MTRKIFKAIMSAVLSVLAINILMATYFVYQHFQTEQHRQLVNETVRLQKVVDIFGEKAIEQWQTSIYRITLLDNNGNVKFDTKANLANLTNHSQREEIKQAMSQGKGKSQRFSDTLFEKTRYVAVKLANNDILRLSLKQLSFVAILLNLIPIIAVLVILSISIATILSKKMSKNIVDKLNDLNLDKPLYNKTYNELVPLLQRIDEQKQQIKTQMALLQQKNDEFYAIINTLSEGLLLVDRQYHIISINHSAKQLFEQDDTILNQSVEQLDGLKKIKPILNKALEGQKGEYHFKKLSKSFRVSVTTIMSNDDIIGFILLCIDISDIIQLQEQRKAFTANVSHELKTPMQSIMASAELIESQLVKPEDTNRFIGYIKEESKRLLTLINDIIRLSQLDEGQHVATEMINLDDIIKDIKNILLVSAERKHIKWQLSLQPCRIHAVRQHIYDIIYNLCDNAIAYNCQNGCITIRLWETNSSVLFSVTDTGIGIPNDEQAHIFERFYRVDKSRSKDQGGTGLGLAIVKNALALCNGTITCTSQVGKGTTMTVTFDK